MEKFFSKGGLFLKITGIICEYNPLHLGHKKQLDMIRSLCGDDCGIVCLMSGNYVQRGEPAIFHRSHRAKAAVAAGADLVLELPVTASLSSAEGFADIGVSILSGFCDSLCFGAECSDAALLIKTAEALLSPSFSPALKEELKKGVSFPTARQAALSNLGVDSQLLSLPNNILAVEYCKAILSQGSSMQPMPILRQGNYHDETPDSKNPSATSLRLQITKGNGWLDYVPKEAHSCFADAQIHTLSAGERAILGRLKTMTDEEFSLLPFGSEGLWRKLMHAARKHSTLDEIINATKSKRYTRTRINRMILCGFLGITSADLSVPAPYVRVLAFNEKGRYILNQSKDTCNFVNIGEKTDAPYQALETRCDSLYSLFSQQTPTTQTNERIYYKKDSSF